MFLDVEGKRISTIFPLSHKSSLVLVSFTKECTTFVTMKSKLLYILLLATLAGCSGSGFKLKGKIKELHGAELYVYSPAMEFDRIDTIRVGDEEFSYSTSTPYEMPLVIIFGNSSELPIFSTPGKDIKLEGNASSLKEIVVSGSESNELFTKFRKHILGMSESNIEREAEKFIRSHQESVVSAYLLHRYFHQRGCDAKVSELGKLLNAAQPDNKLVEQTLQQNAERLRIGTGSKAPDFSFTAWGGAKRTLSSYKGKYLLLVFTAEWNTQSRGVRNTLKKLNSEFPAMKIAQIAFDVQKPVWENTMHIDSVGWDNAIEVETFESSISQAYAVGELPCYFLISPTGKIVLRGTNPNDLESRIREKMKK